MTAGNGLHFQLLEGQVPKDLGRKSMNRRVSAAIALFLPAIAWSQTRVAPLRLPTGGQGRSAGPAVRVGVSLTNVLQLQGGLPTLLPAVLGGPTIDAAPLPITALPSSILPAIAGPTMDHGAIESPARAATTKDLLEGMAASLAGPSVKSADDKSGRRFDGAADMGSATDLSVEPETVTQDLAEAQPETMDLWFSGRAKKSLVKSELFGSIREVKSPASRRYWEKFKKDVPVRILWRGSTLFVSRVTDNIIKPIGALTKKDLAGTWGEDYLKKHSIAQVRRAVIDYLKEKAAYRGGQRVITLQSEVSVVRFTPYGEARQFPENRDEEPGEAGPRAPVEIPKALSEAYRFLPKLVVLDTRLFEGTIPFALQEDIGKLMKAGIYFLFLSDKPSSGPGSLEEQMTKGLTAKQQDKITRYKLVTLTEGGNALSGYEGKFPKALPLGRFDMKELDIMRHAAMSVGGVVAVARAREFTVEIPKGADAAAFTSQLESRLKEYAVPSGGYVLSPAAVEGRPAVSIRPHSIVSALSQTLAALRDEEGLYVNHSDLMVISKDPEVLKTLNGSVQPAAHAPRLEGAALADMSLASLLGPYRENVPGDFGASASKIQGFLLNKDRLGGGGDNYSIYMLMGHVIHSAFNWAVWNYRNNGGILPPAGEVVAKAVEIWNHEESGRTQHVLEEAGYSMGDFQTTVELRVGKMHEMASELLKAYPIVVGTELPNLHVFDRFKKGAATGRDILRLIYDFVIARETPEGLEVMVVDFKSGQSATTQTFDKDTQVQLYDLVPRRAWRELPVPYGVNGEMKKVANSGVTFIYPGEMKSASIDEWSRIKFEKFIRSVVGRMRKAMMPPPPSKKAGIKSGKKPAKKGAAAK